MRPKIYFLTVLMFLFAVFLILPSVKALCPEIILTKDSFFPGETVQIEIDGQFIRNIVPTDVSVVRQSDNVRLPLEVMIAKISNEKFFAYFDIPSLNVNFEDDYLVKVAARCSNGFFVRSEHFIIKKPIANYYEDFENSLGSWSYLNKEEHAAVLMAVSYKNSLYQQARTAFNSKNCPNSCNVVENSLAAIATKEQQFVQWIQNKANGSCWGSPCSARQTAYALLALKLANGTINQSSLAWLQTNAQEDEEKAILLFLGSGDYNGLVTSQSYYGYWLKSNSADRATTALATFALKNIAGTISEPEEQLAISDSIKQAEKWLLENFNSGNMKEKAFTLFFVFPKENIEAIMAVWPGVVKIESPASFSLLLQNKGTNDINALVQGMNTTSATSIAEGSSKSIQFSVPLMTTPDATTLFQEIEISYENSYGYSTTFNVPLIIFTQLGETTTNVTIITNETNVTTPEQIEIIKNETVLNQTNKTTEPEPGQVGQVVPSLIEKPLRFDEDEIIRTIVLGKSASIVLELSNELDQEVRNVYIQKSSILSLMGGVTISPSFMSKMDPLASEDILITIAPERSGYYEGTIDSSVKIDDKTYKDSVIFKINVLQGTVNGTTNQTVPTKTCAELGGKECDEGYVCSVTLVQAKDTYKCCVPPTKCEKIEEEGGASFIGIIIFCVVVLALIIVLIMLSRKKKKQMSEILEEAKQKYGTTFPRT